MNAGTSTRCKAPARPNRVGGILRDLVSGALLVLVRMITAVRATGFPETVAGRPRVYVANHRSHGDFVLVWAALPEAERHRLRPVAGRDYWGRVGLRRWLVRSIFNALLIDRRPRRRRDDPLPAMHSALERGSSLLVFPEGTRNETDAPLLPFRNGIARLAQRRPDVEFVPVWIENLNRVLPKGEFLPVPLLCKVSFGAPMRAAEGEDRIAFRDRLHDALLALGRERSGGQEIEP